MESYRWTASHTGSMVPKFTETIPSPLKICVILLPEEVFWKFHCRVIALYCQWPTRAVPVTQPIPALLLNFASLPVYFIFYISFVYSKSFYQYFPNYFTKATREWSSKPFLQLCILYGSESTTEWQTNCMLYSEQTKLMSSITKKHVVSWLPNFSTSLTTSICQSFLVKKKLLLIEGKYQFE